MLLCALLAISAVAVGDNGLKAWGIESAFVFADSMYGRAKEMYFRHYEVGTVVTVQGLIILALYCDAKHGKGSKALLYLGKSYGIIPGSFRFMTMVFDRIRTKTRG